MGGISRAGGCWVYCVCVFCCVLISSSFAISISDCSVHCTKIYSLWIWHWIAMKRFNFIYLLISDWSRLWLAGKRRERISTRRCALLDYFSFCLFAYWLPLLDWMLFLVCSLISHSPPFRCSRWPNWTAPAPIWSPRTTSWVWISRDVTTDWCNTTICPCRWEREMMWCLWRVSCAF